MNKQTNAERNNGRQKALSSAQQLKQSVLNLDWTWKNYADVLGKIQSLEFNEAGSQEQDEKFKKEVQEILTSLNDPDTLFALSLDLKQANPQAYLDFQKSVISLDPSFEAKFIALEQKLQLALWNDNLSNTSISGGKITQKSPDGFNTTATLDGTQRTLSRSDSKFKLSSAIESDKEAQAAADKVERELNERIKPITQ